jgi:hypothetical protein
LGAGKGLPHWISHDERLEALLQPIPLSQAPAFTKVQSLDAAGQNVAVAVKAAAVVAAFSERLVQTQHQNRAATFRKGIEMRDFHDPTN